MYIYILQAGYEFDVGIHYVGGMNGASITRTLCDQITEGQLLSFKKFYFFF
jgi:hypothetical protein